jgi:hypothetical protein
MSRELWLDLAKKACHPHEKSIFASPWGEEWVLRFAESVAAAERKRMEYDGIHTCHAECQRPACVAVREAVQREPPAAQRQPLTDEEYKALVDARNEAMQWTIKGRVPECGAFAGIAQNLDYLCEQLSIEAAHGIKEKNT